MKESQLYNLKYMIGIAFPPIDEWKDNELYTETILSYADKAIRKLDDSSFFCNTNDNIETVRFYLNSCIGELNEKIETYEKNGRGNLTNSVKILSNIDICLERMVEKS